MCLCCIDDDCDDELLCALLDNDERHVSDGNKLNVLCFYVHFLQRGHIACNAERWSGITTENLTGPLKREIRPTVTAAES